MLMMRGSRCLVSAPPSMVRPRLWFGDFLGTATRNNSSVSPSVAATDRRNCRPPETRKLAFKKWKRTKQRKKDLSHRNEWPLIANVQYKMYLSGHLESSYHSLKPNTFKKVDKLDFIWCYRVIYVCYYWLLSTSTKWNRSLLCWEVIVQIGS